MVVDQETFSHDHANVPRRFSFMVHRGEIERTSSGITMHAVKDPYGYCRETKGADADTDTILQCVSQILAERSQVYSRTVLLVYAAALVFFMQAGFAMVCAGAVRRKNVQNAMLKNLLDACGAALAFFCVGYAFAFGGDDPTSATKTFIGTSNFFLMDEDDLAIFLFQYAFSAASATIVAGTLAERCQMAAYLCYSLMLTGWVYPVVAHSVWSPNGFLSAYSIDPLWGVGVIDFAGSGVVHVTGGITALFAAIILGPRRGRFHDDMGRRLDKPIEFPGHSMALQVGIWLAELLWNLLVHVQVKSCSHRLISVSGLLFVFLDVGNLYSLVWMVRIQLRFSTAIG